MENSCLMGKYTLDNGMKKLGPKKATVFKYGQMDQSMKDSGTMIWLVVMEDSFLLMVMYIKETGLMIKHTAMVNISMRKEQHTKVAGTKINKKEKDEKNGQMVPFMKEFTYEAKSMEKELFNGQMVPSITDNGKTIKCMAKENSVGQTVVYIKVITLMIRNMDKVFIHGQMEGCIKEDFIMVNSMAKVSIDKPTAKKFMAYGRKAKKVSYVKTKKNLMSLKTTFDTNIHHNFYC